MRAEDPDLPVAVKRLRNLPPSTRAVLRLRAIPPG